MERVTVEQYLAALEVCRQFVDQIGKEIEELTVSLYPFEDEPLESLNLSARSYNALKLKGAHTVHLVLNKFNSMESLILLYGIGEDSLFEICNAIKSRYGVKIEWKDFSRHKEQQRLIAKKLGIKYPWTNSDLYH